MPIKKRKKVCEVCKKVWEYRLSVFYGEDGQKFCRHDSDVIIDNRPKFSPWERKMISNLPRGKVAVKDSSGIVRVCERQNKKIR